MHVAIHNYDIVNMCLYKGDQAVNIVFIIKVPHIVSTRKINTRVALIGRAKLMLSLSLSKLN